MLGKDNIKIEVRACLNKEQYDSLILFYAPLIGYDALYIYQYLYVKGTSSKFVIGSLLLSLRLTINRFENALKQLETCRLVNTLIYSKETAKANNSYIVYINNPLSKMDFINDDILPKLFIEKIGMDYYQSLCSDLRWPTNPRGYCNYFSSADIGLDMALKNWNEEKEKFERETRKKKQYNSDTIFKVYELLDDTNFYVFPKEYRTDVYLQEIARLGDIYDINYKIMEYLIGQTITDIENKHKQDEFIEYLTSRCQKYKPDYVEVKDGVYHVPSRRFLMNLLGGQDVSPLDNYLLNKLSTDYNLKIDVINALLEYSYKCCDNLINHNFIEKVANDISKKDIKTAHDAKKYFDKYNEAKKERANKSNKLKVREIVYQKNPDDGMTNEDYWKKIEEDEKIENEN